MSVRGVWEKLRSSFPLLGGIVLCVLVALLQPSSDFDQSLSDTLLVKQKAAPAPEYLLVEITGQDVIDFGRPVMSRSNLTKLIAKIKAGGPTRLLIDFSADREIKDQVQRDRASALESFEKDQVGLVTAVRPDNLPAQRYVNAATMLDGRITADADGWHRRLGTLNGSNPAIWLASGELSKASIEFDLRIDHGRYERVSARDVFEDRVDTEGRKVILSASPDVSPTRAYLPLTDTASRASVLAIAAQSVEEEYNTRSAIGAKINIVLSVLAAISGYLCASHATSGPRLFLLGACAVLVTAVLHIAVALQFGVAITPSTAISVFMIITNATLADRLKIFPMLQNFMRGDLSPEETWAWRSQEDSAQPAILFGHDGSIKRANEAGEELVAEFGEGFVNACQPRMGERAQEVAFEKDGEGRVYDLTWPYPNVSLAVGWDMTNVWQEHENLLGQLYSDELTGCVNRRGFDRKLSELSTKGQGYGIFFIDLNGFKAINDTYGHDAGDELLVECAGRLTAMVRAQDTVARLGGDEFAILMGDQDQNQDPQTMIERIVETITVPVDLTAIDRTVSVGAAVGHAVPDQSDEDPADVLRRADQAMYAYKRKVKGANPSRQAA